MSVRRGTTKTDYSLPYPGSKLKIRDEHWYLDNADQFGKVSKGRGFYPFTKEMSQWCGQEVTVNRTYPSVVYGGEEFLIREDGGNHVWNRWMFEDFEDTVAEVDRFIQHSYRTSSRDGYSTRK